MGDALGPLHQREKLLISCVADVGDRIIGLEETTELGPVGMPRPPNPPPSHVPQSVTPCLSSCSPSSPHSWGCRPQSWAPQPAQLPESSAPACSHGHCQHPQPHCQHAPGTSAAPPAQLPTGTPQAKSYQIEAEAITPLGHPEQVKLGLPPREPSSSPTPLCFKTSYSTLFNFEEQRPWGCLWMGLGPPCPVKGQCPYLSTSLGDRVKQGFTCPAH